MGKKPRRKFRRYVRGRVAETITLGTLAPLASTTTPFDETALEEMWCSSIVGIWMQTNFTPALGDGPILVGVMHSDYSGSELEEYLETVGTWSVGDQIAQEIQKRKIRIVGIFDVPEGATQSVTLNDGKPIRTKIGWMISTGQTLDLWAYNLGVSALSTTAPQIDVVGHANLWPS